MDAAGQTICLSMIVKNEAPVVRRSLGSVRPLIDCWVIVDTGSTDGTQDIIREHLGDLPGELHQRPWVDFAHNRSEALALSAAKADYSLIIDADDVFEIPDGFALGRLTADGYYVDIHDAGTRYQRLQLVCNRLRWRYVGVLHEFLVSESAASRGHLPIVMRRIHDGARHRDGQTIWKDVAVLERALAAETNPFLAARYGFYLAQSYRSCGEKNKALALFLRRAQLGYWNEEVFFSLYQAAQIKEELGHDASESIALYLHATKAAPNRAEALHGACRLCRIAGRNREGYELGRQGLALGLPAEGLFVEPWIYEYGLRDEFAVNAYWAGQYQQSLDACLEVLACPTLPGLERERILANARFALAGLAKRARPESVEIMIQRAGEFPAAATPAMPGLVPSRREAGLVSVITPTFNRPQFLRKLIHGLRAQDYPAIEWLILDDSPEPSVTFTDGDRNIFYQHIDRKLSIGEKRNILIDRARGETIIHFDDDDYYAPQYVSSMVHSLGEREADLINLRGWFLYDVRSRFFGYWDLTVTEGPHYRCDHDGVCLAMLEPGNAPLRDTCYGFGFSFAYKKKVWQEVKFPHIDFDEDGHFAREARAGFAVDGIRDISGSCLHYLHEGSISRCFPQYRLPVPLLGRLFPAVAPAEGT
jgi:glycosyltransferase involved in cell wall biosynthesis